MARVAVAWRVYANGRAGGVGSAVLGVIEPWLRLKEIYDTIDFKAVKKGLSDARGGLVRLVGAIRAVTINQVIMNAAVLANPYVLAAAAAIAAITVVALIVRKYWEPIKAFFSGFASALKEKFSPAFDAIKSGLDKLKPVWDAIGGAIGAVVDWFKKLLKPVESSEEDLKAASDAGRDFADKLVLAMKIVFFPIWAVWVILRTMWKLAKAVFSWNPVASAKAAWNGVTGVIGGAVEGAKTFITGLGDKAREVFEATPVGAWLTKNWWAISGIVGGQIEIAKRRVGRAWIAIQRLLRQDPKKILVDAWNGLTSWFDGIVEKFKTFGKNLMKGLADGIRNAISGPLNAVGEVAGGMVNGVQRWLGIQSPSRVFMGIGDDTMVGLDQGLTRGADGPIQRMATTVRRLEDVGRPQLRPRVSAEASFAANAANGGGSMAGAASARPMTINQTFNVNGNVNGDKFDIRALARELDRLSRQGQRSALNDAALA